MRVNYRGRVARASTPERDAVLWAGLIGIGFAVTGIAVAAHAHLGVAAAPFVGRYHWHVGLATVLAPVVAAAVVGATWRGWHERLPWRRLLFAGTLANLAWTLSLALVEGRAGLSHSVDAGGYLADASSVHDDVIGFLRHYVANAPHHSVASRQHPPGPVLLVWAIHRIGIHQPAVLGLILAAIGALSVPLVAIAVRSLCHEPAGRRLIPVLALAPYALWVAVSVDAVTLTIAAAAITCAVIGSEPGRRAWWVAGSGLLIGVAALFSYSAPWLAVSIIAIYFVRRRALLNAVTGLAALVPLGLARAAGFVWPDGLTAAQADFSVRIGPERSWPLWIALDLVVLLIAAGPTMIPAARKIRRTPGWPFVVGATLAVGFAVGSGLSRGEVERSWLPFIPWLLVPAVAPERRPDRPGVVVAAAVPLGLITLGAAAAVILEAALRSPW